MINSIQSSSALSQVQFQAKPASPVGETSGNGFAELVEDFVKQTNDAQLSSDSAISDLVEGKSTDVQQVVMAVANAEMSFQLFMEIRNKLIDSYNELTRMQF